MKYKVTFDHYLDAETPQAAAVEALRIMRETGTYPAAPLVLFRVAEMETPIKEGARWIGESDNPNDLDRAR